MCIEENEEGAARGGGGRDGLEIVTKHVWLNSFASVVRHGSG